MPAAAFNFLVASWAKLVSNPEGQGCISVGVRVARHREDAMGKSAAVKKESAVASDDVLPSAKDVMRQVAEIEAKKAADYLRKEKAEQAEKKALLDQLSKPSGLSEEEKKKRAAAVINRAVKNGLTEVRVHRFPKELCTDFGRAINQQEAGWEKTLTGLPKEMYQLWYDHLRPRGYKLRYQV